MITRMLVQTTLWLAAMGAILFLAAGDWRWLQGRGGGESFRKTVIEPIGPATSSSWTDRFLRQPRTAPPRNGSMASPRGLRLPVFPSPVLPAMAARPMRRFVA
jgi:hypothetical protein